MNRVHHLLGATLAAGALLTAVAPAAHAVVDPVAASLCLASSATDLTTVVDPAAPGVPSEVPAVHCLAP